MPAIERNVESVIGSRCGRRLLRPPTPSSACSLSSARAASEERRLPGGGDDGAWRAGRMLLLTLSCGRRLAGGSRWRSMAMHPRAVEEPGEWRRRRTTGKAADRGAGDHDDGADEIFEPVAKGSKGGRTELRPAPQRHKLNRHPQSSVPQRDPFSNKAVRLDIGLNSTKKRGLQLNNSNDQPNQQLSTSPRPKGLKPSASSLHRPTDDGALLRKETQLPTSTKKQGSGTVSVKFSIAFRTDYGQRLRVVGSSPALGDWELLNAPEMEWSEGDFWHITVPLPAGKVYEYKYVVVAQNGVTPIFWQKGNNSVLALGLEEKEVDVLDNWEGLPGASLLSGGVMLTREKKLLNWATEIKDQLELSKSAVERMREEMEQTQKESSIAREELQRVRAELRIETLARQAAEHHTRELELVNRRLKAELEEQHLASKRVMEEALRILTEAIDDKEANGDKPNSDAESTPEERSNHTVNSASDGDTVVGNESATPDKSPSTSLSTQQSSQQLKNDDNHNMQQGENRMLHSSSQKELVNVQSQGGNSVGNNEVHCNSDVTTDSRNIKEGDLDEVMAAKNTSKRVPTQAVSAGIVSS